MKIVVIAMLAAMMCGCGPIASDPTPQTPLLEAPSDPDGDGYSRYVGTQFGGGGFVFGISTTADVFSRHGSPCEKRRGINPLYERWSYCAQECQSGGLSYKMWCQTECLPECKKVSFDFQGIILTEFFIPV
jgi:hypothetical protein